jgi:nitroimidazol reductase NimA-like FMN-containing flavoprotein (pyridoxamine 5'-phosphate oxidase superfamily)
VLVTVETTTWQTVIARLVSERSYWLATVAPDGAPHATPVWGAVVDDVWYFYSERRTVKARNLAANPRVVLHLADCADVLIVHGHAQDIGHPSTRRDVVATFATKYARPGDLPFLPLADPAFDVLYALRPSRALLWQLDEYEGSQRRWRSADA